MRLENLTLVNTIIATMDDTLKQVRIALPCKVLSFDAKKQRVVVQPSILAVIRDDESQEKMINRLGEKIGVRHIEMPVIENVPVSYLRAGNYSITIPIQAGDTGTLLFSSRSFERWKTEGGIARQEDLNLFEYKNTIYLPFIANDINALSDYSSSALEIRAGNDKISMDGVNINITTSGNVNLTATQVDINADIVNLAGGGGQVARVGDMVDLNPVSPTYSKILTGSNKVYSG